MQMRKTNFPFCNLSIGSTNLLRERRRRREEKRREEKRLIDYQRESIKNKEKIKREI